MSRWISSRAVDDLIAQQKYDQAIGLLEERLQTDPENARVRLQYGNALVSKGEKERAAKVFLGLVEQLASDGLVPDAIAVLKKLKRMEPARSDLEETLADSYHDRGGHDVAGPLVERSPLFSDFSRDELLEVIRGLELRCFPPGAIVVTEGEAGDSLLILTSGSVRTFVRNQAGRNVEVRLMEEGDFFGEISLLTGKARTATVTVASRCELLELDRASLDDISRRHPRVRIVVEEFYAKRAGSEREREARSS